MAIDDVIRSSEGESFRENQILIQSSEKNPVADQLTKKKKKKKKKKGLLLHLKLCLKDMISVFVNLIEQSSHWDDLYIWKIILSHKMFI